MRVWSALCRASVTHTKVTVATERPIEKLAELPGVHDVRSQDDHVHFDVEGTSIDAAMQLVAASGIRSIVSHPPTLEDLFLRHYDDTPSP